MNVLIADNLERERAALKQLFDQDAELSVVGEAAEANGLLIQLQQTRPDLVVLNWELPGCQISHMLSAIRRLHSSLKVVVFGEDAGLIKDALIAGAHAFVCKREPVEELLNTVRAVGGLSPCYI
jgi:DNA-binding NarL/FixJ family response regulator